MSTKSFIKELPELRNFFSSYFHEDFLKEYKDAQEAIRDYIAGARPESIRRVVTELDLLSAQNLNEAMLEDYAFSRLGNYYYPAADGITYSNWLRMVRSELTGKSDEARSEHKADHRRSHRIDHKSDNRAHHRKLRQ